jgi:DNA repair photolyase
MDTEQRGSEKPALSTKIGGFPGEVSMDIQEIECKTALSKSSLPGLMYSLNPYRGCQHNCAYCYAPNVLRQPREHWGDTLLVKKNIPLVLASEMKKKKPGVVGLSTVTDPYQPREHHYKVTRYCLEQLLIYDYPVHIQTKSALVLRDIDLLKRFSDSQVMFSIGTLHEQERQLLEPNASSIQARLTALQQCAAAGLKTAVFFGPVYPTMRIDEIPTFVEKIKNAGAQEIWIDMLRLKPGITENIQKTLQGYPLLLQRFLKPMENYGKIREELQKQGKKHTVRIIDAF